MPGKSCAKVTSESEVQLERFARDQPSRVMCADIRFDVCMWFGVTILH
jgi:hypothetical protein